MVKISDGFDVIVNEPVIRDRLVFEIDVDPIKNVADELPYDLLAIVSEVFVIPVGAGKELEVAIIDEILQNSQLYILQKHLTVYSVLVLGQTKQKILM